MCILAMFKLDIKRSARYKRGLIKTGGRIFTCPCDYLKQEMSLKMTNGVGLKKEKITQG